MCMHAYIVVTSSTSHQRAVTHALVVLSCIADVHIK